jgi:hypothetical protein
MRDVPQRDADRQPFAGILVRLGGGGTGLLRARTGDLLQIQLKDYTLEPTQRTLQRYGDSSGDTPRRLWQQIQRLSFSLDEHGSRNKHVLRDRLQAIRTLLTERGARSLSFDLCTGGGARALLGLEPFEVTGVDVHS